MIARSIISAMPRAHYDPHTDAEAGARPDGRGCNSTALIKGQKLESAGG
jgi:hypothetical protein